MAAVKINFICAYTFWLIRWVWTVWHAALQNKDVEYHQEDLALQHWANNVQSRVSMSACECNYVMWFGSHLT